MITRARQPSELGLHVLTAIHQTPSAAQCHCLDVEYMFEVTLLICQLQVMKSKSITGQKKGILFGMKQSLVLPVMVSIIMSVVTDIQFKLTAPSSGHDNLFHSVHLACVPVTWAPITTRINSEANADTAHPRFDVCSLVQVQFLLSHLCKNIHNNRYMHWNNENYCV